MSVLVGLMLWGLHQQASAEQPKEYCFSPEQVDNIIIPEIERGRKADELINQYEAALKAATDKINLLSEKVDTINQKFEETKRQMGSEQKLADERDKMRLDEIEQLKKPRWGTMFQSFGVGAAVGVMAILLL